MRILTVAGHTRASLGIRSREGPKARQLGCPGRVVHKAGSLDARLSAAPSVGVSGAVLFICPPPPSGTRSAGAALGLAPHRSGAELERGCRSVQRGHTFSPSSAEVQYLR